MNGLKPAYTTLKSKEFNKIYSKGQKFIGQFFVVFILKNTEEFKVGFVASKKVGNAVSRNRAKRVMREMVRVNQNLMRKDINIILVARKQILTTNYTDTEGSFLNFLSKFCKYKQNV